MHIAMQYAWSSNNNANRCVHCAVVHICYVFHENNNTVWRHDIENHIGEILWVWEILAEETDRTLVASSKWILSTSYSKLSIRLLLCFITWFSEKLFSIRYETFSIQHLQILSGKCGVAPELIHLNCDLNRLIYCSIEKQRTERSNTVLVELRM